MYQDKIVVAIKHDGRILREYGDIVKLPFGSEFSILIKNLNNRRAAVQVQIDGTDVLDGSELILDANSELELKRFLKRGNLTTGNAFKFIERTESIENGPRGIRAEDGIVRVESWFERPITTYRTDWHQTQFGNPYWHDLGKVYSTNGASGALRRVTLGSEPHQKLKSVSSPGDMVAQASTVSSVNDVGITVPGSEVQQSFNPTSGIIKDATSNVIVLRLVGKTEQAEVKQAVTVKTKPKCITCGKVNKANAKFCTECGTSLQTF